jgi:DNA-binding PadR family transcriptional regulator
MDLRAAILGLLSWKPSSGYDLKQFICDSDIHYWSGNNNQIYKSLLELQQEGLVTHQVQLQESLPAKKIYSITEKGLAALYQSLTAAPELPELRKNFLIQLAWAEILSDQEVQTLLETYAEEVVNHLHLLRGQAARAGKTPARSPREKYLWKRIADNQIRAYQTELEWIRQTRQDLRDRRYGEKTESA